MLPPLPASFVASVPQGGRVRVRYREAIGLAQFVYGGFEETELRMLCSHLPAGSLVFDVGANIGYFTIPLALAVGPSGSVLAFEPEAENVKRLADNVALNRLTNVEIRQVAIGACDGETTLYLGDESVYHTTAIDSERLPITTAHETGQTVTVGLAQLDTVWRQIGSPDVAFVKIDVEGTELSVLNGSRKVIESCRPSLLIETEVRRLDAVRQVLADFDYAHSQPKGFFISNHLFTPR